MNFRPIHGTLALLVSLALLTPTAAMANRVHLAPADSDRVRRDQWHLRYLKISEVHRISRGAGVTVAVPDTGVDEHPDLRNNLLSGKDIIRGGSGDGRTDGNGHGTGMAGLIAAHGQSSHSGALGIAPSAKILPIMSSSRNNLGDADDLAPGIEFAVSNGADVISISSGGGSSPRLIEAVRTALLANVVVVAGAGNVPSDKAMAYPASEPGVVAVGGIDQNGSHAAISVTGPELDLVAPAVDIYSTKGRLVTG